ncbi:hypothetical protein DKT69_18815 [Micromonospora sicca]|uniref:Uncharacterized protein n=1 Tax=Micromonospora sicca TaxID=2202420 RepID=A0A317DH62_9ACTN|nr:maleylpyruvate isomerase N-terminal domain-containing protein [Micromonospora sp. ATA51]PWR13897.1 hypothetical protein DKT69_18815 [Micromonospora sp. 4G51]
MAQRVADRAESGQLPDEILAVAKRLADLIGGLPTADIAIPGASWTVAEAAAHLAMANELMATIAGGRPATHGDGTKAGLASANAQSLSYDGLTGGGCGRTGSTTSPWSFRCCRRPRRVARPDPALPARARLHRHRRPGGPEPSSDELDCDPASVT